MIRSLTPFRFFAALLVFMFHIGFRKYELGYIGVSFFFVLSGFILTYNYHQKFDKLTSKNISSFYVARFAKIYPLHVLTFLMAFPVVLKSQVDGVPNTILKGFINVFLLQSYFPDPKIFFSFNTVSWSLSNEMFFYILFPFIIYGLGKFLKVTNNTRLIFLLVFTWSIVLFVFSTVKNVTIDDWVLYIFPISRVFDFFVGVLLALIFINKSKNRVKINCLQFSILEISTLVLLLISILYSPNINQSLRFSIYFLPFISFLIYVYSFQKGIVSKILSNKFLLFLGEISFSFYMIHLLTIIYVSKITRHFLIENTFITNSSSFVISIMLSLLLYSKFEEPLRKKIRNAYNRKYNQKKDSKTTKTA